MVFYLRKGIILVAIVLIFFSVCACSTPGPELAIAFDTIEQTEVSGTGRIYEQSNPMIVAIPEFAEIESIRDLVSTNAYNQLQEISFTDTVIIGAFQGKKSSTGYGIEIEQLTFQSGTLTAQAKLSEPVEGMETGAMITSPYHIIQVDKAEFRNQELTVQLSNGQRVVASTEVFIP